MQDNDLKKVLSVFLTLQSTKELPRQGFINFGFKRNDSDSVAAHSYTVCALAFFLAKMLKQTYPAIDADRVLRIALVHDMGEAISGDIGYHVKRFAGEMLKQVEAKTFGMLVGELSFQEEMRQLYEEYNDAASTEAKIVKLADALDALTQMLLTSGADLRSAKMFMHEKEDDLGGDPLLGDTLVTVFQNACRMLKNQEVGFIG
jgi:putative hydrolase of HD superfamily